MIGLELETAALSPAVLLSNEKSSLPGIADKLESESRKIEGKRKLIFVIDDETFITDTLVEILNDAGYEAHPFYNGRGAIELSRLRCPDIVVSDVVMPRLNGVETALAIQELCPTARILLFSGQAGIADILKDARAKGHEFQLLPKPIHPDQLLKRLSALTY